MTTLWLAAFILGDLIVLKSGKTEEGVFVGEDDQSVRYRDASGQMHVEPKSMVLRIERTRTKSNVYEDIASGVSVEKREDYYYLCMWAEEQGLTPSVDKLCRIAVSYEDLRGRAFLKLGGAAKGDEARILLRRAAISDPTLVEAAKALRASGEEVALPLGFLRGFITALDSVLQGKYEEGLSQGKLALAELDEAQRRKAESQFKRETGLTVDKYLSLLERLSKSEETVACSFCKGKGYVDCVRCKGKGWLTCQTCSGRGRCERRTFVPNRGVRVDAQTCRICKGTGRINCGKCTRLGKPVQEQTGVEGRGGAIPPRIPTGAPEMSSPGVTVSDGRIKRVPPGGSWRVVGESIGPVFAREYSGRTRCPRCGGKKAAEGESLVVEEPEKLRGLAKIWKSELARSGGVWGEGTKLCSFEGLHADLRVEPERSTSFYQGRWITANMRRMYLSAGGQKKDEGAVSQFEEWKSGYKCRMVAEHAIEIPADPRAWRGILGLYGLSANSAESRFGARQVFHATFRAGGGEASVISDDGVLLAETDPELALELDTPVETGGAGEVELWFRVSGVGGGRGATLAVTVLAARVKGRTTAFF